MKRIALQWIVLTGVRSHRRRARQISCTREGCSALLISTSLPDRAIRRLPGGGFGYMRTCDRDINKGVIRHDEVAPSQHAETANCQTFPK